MSPRESTARYNVQVDGQVYGPYPENVLADWIAAGRITEDTPVQAIGGLWVPAKDWIRRSARSRAGLTPEDEAQVEADPSANQPVASAGVSPGDTVAGQPYLTRRAAEAAARDAARTAGAPPRDRVVIIGRRRSGKTIFLASVYARLWKSLNGMTAKAVSGVVHQQLMDTWHTLQRGQWPAATLDTMQVDMDIEYSGATRRLVTLDFAGEMFRKAFVEEQHDFPGVAELTDHIDRAVAVLLLVDPAVIAGGDHAEAMDDDFGLVQAAMRIRGSSGGAEVPIALVLTKADQHQDLIDASGGTRGFVRQYFPALVRGLKQLPIFQVSAVQTDRGPDGAVRPRPESEPVNVEAPLKFCLERIEAVRAQAEIDDREKRREAEDRRIAAEEAAKDRRANLMIALTVTTILAAGGATVAWILFRTGG